jgi:hypothetical protein
MSRNTAGLVWTLSLTGCSAACFHLSICALAGQPARENFEEAVSIKAHEKKDTRGLAAVAFLLNSRNTLEATVTIACYYLKNLRPDHSLPYTFIVEGCQQNREVLRLEKVRNDSPCAYGKWLFHFKIGVPSQLSTKDYPYALPYSAQERHEVIQSSRTDFSHFKGSADEFAVDFQMSQGTVVRAARAGKVIACRDDSNKGGPDPELRACENYVVVKHDDGTYALYSHFKQSGLFVKAGQSVAEGEKLGLSGATGWAERPHLHFSVYRVQDGFTGKAIPVRMKKAGKLIDKLKEGQSY